MPGMQAAPLDRLFTALADPSRRAMVERLCRAPASVKDLAEPFGMRLPSAVKHLKVLEDSGIVVSRKSGRVRTYAVDPQGLAAIQDWVGQRKVAVNAAFDRLERAIAENPEAK
jgi:DNA-binding transcriptional ArsR family regulator